MDFEQLTIREALEILTIKIEQQTDKKITPNFIIRDLKGAFKNRTVTMQLNNLPANILLEYIANQVGGSIRYDRHAIVISPRKLDRTLASQAIDHPSNHHHLRQSKHG